MRSSADTLRIFIGWDSREPIAAAVLADSIIRRASIPVAITPLRLPALRHVYTRTRGPLESTEFSLTRFLVPHLSDYEGLSLFLDGDMLMQADVAELLLYPLAQPDKAVFVCQHDYIPTASTKFLGQPQTVYPRKNWSSFMLFVNDRCRALTPAYVNAATGLELHRLTWIDDRQVGALPLDWNHLVGDYVPHAEARCLHWTNGGPWCPEFTDVDHADRWLQGLAAMHGQEVLA